ncbi:IS3 family transposase [Arthrobacter glacialis]|uniref:IS3 family transposase n=1 Tax=Arthrobacter glacialis TaxID=1664 RepID=UPI0024341DD4|nr:IS3 family transposase [Arthrobacter glacialis]
MQAFGGHSAVKALELLGLSSATYYREKAAPVPVKAMILQRERVQPATLNPEEIEMITGWLSAPENMLLSVAKVYYKYLDQGLHVASKRSWHRVAAAAKLSGDRRRQASHPPKKIPQLIAACPNQVWCWDISKVKGTRLRQFFDLYLIMDIYSRYIVGWRVEHTEVSATAADMLTQAVNEAPHAPEYLHSDNGASMKSTIMAATLAGHGIARSFSRPKVSNDNPFSESLFKTFKYETTYPQGFPTLEAAREYVAAFVIRYNNSHQHEGIAGHTPATVHHGLVDEINTKRQIALDASYAANPSRFTRRPMAPQIDAYVAINDPKQRTQQNVNLSQTG